MLRFAGSTSALLIACAASGCGFAQQSANPSKPAATEARPPSRTSSGAAAKPADRPTLCSYRVTAPAAEPFLLRVTARCAGGQVERFLPNTSRLAPFVRAAESTRDPTTPFLAVRRGNTAELTYEVDLDAMARNFEDVDVAERFGASLLAPASSFLLRPDPPFDSVPVQVVFDGADTYATGLRPNGAHYAIESHELHTATYSAFGVKRTREFDVAGTRVRIALLDGALDVDFETLARWVGDSARAVQAFYGRATDSHITVLLAPVPERGDIPFGKLLPESGPGIVVLIGEHVEARDLYRDWVLVHELFHVGSPSFLGEGKWLDEGLATYFEPIIRARAGFISEADVWSEFFAALQRGLDVMTTDGLEHSRGYADMYWGGALFCFLADIQIRSHTSNAKGLEDGVRAVLAAGGTASEVWALSDAIAVAEHALGVPILSELVARHARKGSPVDLPALFSALGVSRQSGTLVLDDAAPLADIRRAIVQGDRRELR
jgi:hypothetical protein